MQNSNKPIRKYTLDGTKEEIEKILQTQFNFDKKLSEFYFYMLLPYQEIQKENLGDEIPVLFYLSKKNKYTTPVFKTRFSISFSDIEKDLLCSIFVQASELLIKKDLIVFSIIIECLIWLFRNGTHIQDYECCPYYQAIKWKSIHRNSDYFSVKDIMPMSDDKNCIHLDCINDKKWKCDYCENDTCNVSERYFSDILDKLCDRHVFIKNKENLYRFSK